MSVELVVFVIAGAICIGGALGVVLNRNPVHAALSLVATLFGVAVLFVAQEVHFLAAVQVIVYAGAIVVLFLFVIMLLGVDRTERLDEEPIVGQRILAGVLGVAILALPARGDPVDHRCRRQRRRHRSDRRPRDPDRSPGLQRGRDR